MNSVTSGDPTRPGAGRAETGHAFSERLWPALWIWFAGLVLAGFAAVIGMPFGSLAGAAFAVVMVGGFAALMVMWTPVIQVAGGQLTAGRAHVDVRFLGDVTALDPAAMRQACGPDLDMRAYLCIRGWIATGVRVELADPDDPTPYWLLSSRRPTELAVALTKARQQAGPDA